MAGSAPALPLEGVRILTLEAFGAGPFGSMYLADLGAEVIKIENRATGGDAGRAMGPHFLGEHDSHYFQTFNLNKKSCSLDLKHPLGREAFHRLVASADALMNNLRGDQPEKLGLTYAALKHVNPPIVCAHISAYGRDNERKSWPGYDYLMQAEAGFMQVTGEPGALPTRMGLSMVDFMSGITTSLALVAKLVSAKRTGIGGDVDVSLLDVAVHQLSYLATAFLNEGAKAERTPRGAHPFATPVQLIKTQDGWVYVMCMTEKFWQILIDTLGRRDIATDSRFATMQTRLAHRDELTRVLDAEMQKQSTAYWLDKLSGSVPTAAVQDIEQALNSPFLTSNGMIRDTPHPLRPAFRTLANPIRLDGQRLNGKIASALGGDTESVLRELGYDDEALDRLRRERAV